jgi:PAS domain S-box-containing protein
MELAKSEKQFRTFAESVPGVVSIYDRYPDDSINFLYRGPGLEKMFGKKLAQRIYEDPYYYFNLIPAEDREKLEAEAIKAVNSDGLLDTEYRLKISDNNYIWVRSSFRVSRLENGAYRWQGIIADITEQKKMEMALRENQELLSKTQEIAKVGSWTYNLRTGEIYWSKVMATIMGVDENCERSLKTIRNLIHPGDVQRVRKEFIKSLRDRKPYDIYHRIVRNDGSVRFLNTKTENMRDNKGRLLKTIGMSQDITEIVNTQEIIRQSEQLALALIEESPLGISIRDKFGTLIMHNQAWKNIRELTSEQIQEYRNKRNSLIFNEKDDYLKHHLPEIKKIYNEGGNYFIPELEIHQNRDKFKWISQRFYALKDKNNEVERVVILTEDITERKLAEDRIRKDLQEKNILLQEVHHRVKNNMQVISSMLKLQASRIKDAKVLDLFRNSQNRVKSMALIHERIYRSPDLASVDIEDYIRNLTRFLFINCNCDINKINLNVEVEKISVDMNKAIPLGLIINELISNVLKHAFPENGKGSLNIKFFKDKQGFHVLEVSDDGIGCDANLVLKNPQTLGLQLVHSLTDQLQGKLDFDSQNGTKFTIRF